MSLKKLFSYLSQKKSLQHKNINYITLYCKISNTNEKKGTYQHIKSKLTSTYGIKQIIVKGKI